MKSLNVLSYGGGVNSTALILLLIQKKIKIDLIIYADVGSEHPETDKFINYFKKWCKSKKLTFVTVRSHLGNIYDYYHRNNIIPYRMFRSCTDKFKIRVINKYLKKNYSDFRINMFLGIDAGESHRAKELDGNYYPLVEHNVDRAGCISLIKDAGLKIPRKSGCWFCPFQPKQEWINLLNNDPDLFEKAIELEKNCRSYPEFHLTQIPLEKLKIIIKSQTKLSDFMNQKDTCVSQCTYCHL